MEVSMGLSSGHTPAGGINVIVAAVVVVLIVRVTKRKSPLRHNPLLGLVLVLVGAYESYGYVQASGVRIGDFSSPSQALSFRIWAEGEVVYVQGSWITAVLWIVGLAQHLLVGLLADRGLGSATLLLYVGAMVLAERWFVRARARSKKLLDGRSTMTGRG